MSFLAILDRVLPLLKKEKQQGKVCPNGHVMHPSWDTCPYCLEMQQAMMGGGGASPLPMPSAGQRTAKKISRKHATVRYEGGEFQIADLDSSNGTFVNDEKVQKHDLIDNDILKLGDIEFEFKCRAMREKRE